MTWCAVFQVLVRFRVQMRFQLCELEGVCWFPINTLCFDNSFRVLAGNVRFPDMPKSETIDGLGS